VRFRRSSRRGGRSYHKQNCYPKLRDMVRAQYLIVMLAVFGSALYFGFQNQIGDSSIVITLLCWAGVLATSRRMAAVVLHQGVHERLSGNSTFDKIVGELVTILMFSRAKYNLTWKRAVRSLLSAAFIGGLIYFSISQTTRAC
jgi:fatty acid desaturase